MLPWAKLCFSVDLKYFLVKSLKTSHFSQKSDITERSSEIHRKFVFLNNFEKINSWGKLGFGVNNYVVQTREMRKIFKKTVFLLNISHIQLNYGFLLLGSIFSEIHWKLLFLVKKVIISEWSSEVLKKCFFSKKIEKFKI